ncbi:hypothetical protein [Brevundimonas sp.]|uniref:hypothetical protein n=1 Tax=Brevundimonas sp. TaxID=1871086 RepID=UPI00356194D1
MLPINRAVTDAPDLNAAAFKDVDIVLYELYVAASKNGAGLIQGRTFTGCRFQGPAIILVSEGVTFDDTNFGDSRGGIQNLLLRPVGDKAIGTIPMRDCRFFGCEFYNIGFTGSGDILDQLAAIPTLTAPQQ